MREIGFALLDGDNGRNIFQEINAALFAFASLALFVAAGGALIAQSGVAALAETRNIASLGAAFRAFHNSILTGSTARGSVARSCCTHVVNTVRGGRCGAPGKTPVGFSAKASFPDRACISKTGDE